MQTLYNILIRTTSPVITSKVLEALILIVNNFEKPEQIGSRSSPQPSSSRTKRSTTS